MHSRRARCMSLLLAQVSSHLCLPPQCFSCLAQWHYNQLLQRSASTEHLSGDAWHALQEREAELQQLDRIRLKKMTRQAMAGFDIDQPMRGEASRQ